MALLRESPIVAKDGVYRLAGGAQRPLPRTADPDSGPFLVLGGQPDEPGLNWHDNPALACAAVLLVGKVSAAELAAATEAMPDPAAPIADFAENTQARHDFAAAVLDGRTLAEARLRFVPIMRRLGQIPFHAAREDRNELLTLRLAYSRNSPIEAHFSPGSPTVVDYPLLGNVASSRVGLENLALLGLLRRRHFIRTHACDRCASYRLLAFEACQACGSSDLADELIVHHYRCGCQEPESSFMYGNELICPKCRRALRHFGMDYGKPGTIVHCRSCGNISPEPDPSFVCMDCTAVIAGQQASAIDWFHYDLTDVGIAALHAGRLPNGADHTKPTGAPALHAMREFQLLASAALRTARRFSRPFTLARLTPQNLVALGSRSGAGPVGDILQRASTAMAEALSDGEFVTSANGAVLIGFPEMDAEGAEALIDHARSAASVALDLRLDFNVALYTAGEASEMLGRC